MNTNQKYRTLNPSKKEIRILKIHANSKPNDVNDARSTITCSLETVALRDANPFYALSYVWGEPEPTVPILVNGRAVSVRTNLWNFLHTLRSRFCQGPTDSIRVWADYICIQQEDNEEKKSQIGIMGEIYQAADAVYAWLGDVPSPGRNDAERHQSISKHNHWGKALNQMARDGLSEVQIIASSSYWTRLWIKQEIILPKEIWFFYGKEIKYWKDLRLAAISKEERARLPRFPTSSASSGQPTNALMTAVLNLRALRKGYDGLPELVQRFKDAGCQDSKDRIYALLSLTDPKTRDKISVDYEKSFMQVLLETYPHWTGDSVEWLETADRAHKIPVFQYKSFLAHMLMVIGRERLHLITGEKKSVKRDTARAIFTTFGLLKVTNVKVVASIRHSTLTPGMESQQSAWQGCAFVLEVFVATPLPDEPYHRRGYLVYANSRPAEGDLVGRIGNQMFFLRSRDCKAGTGGGQDLILQAVGTEALPLRSSNSSSVHSSTALFQHPCRWYRSRPAMALFQLIDTSCHEERQRQTPFAVRGGVSILYNASALVTLLVDSNMFQTDGPQQDREEEDDLPQTWAPWMLEEDGRGLGLCRTCRVAGRPSIAEERRDFVEGLRDECNCTRFAQQSRYEL